ncbi:39S ribosomal protein L28, mitochondrial [Patella vulgata]|uniref:39S ribosomal protein L28, mitochondrial n=1 Tax=Patella vulgata TaxID=6465 RepID=UPI00217FC290|nr:39S ribosomal protein L28, mitochondrial [Patella vulgata]
MAYRISAFRYAPYQYKFSNEVKELLPQHYLRRCKEYMEADPLTVHWQPDTRKFTVHPKTGERVKVQNVPLKVMYPEVSNKDLWGGEGIIVGHRKKKHLSPKTPKLWLPYIFKRPLYSEIFDKFYLVRVTPRTLNLIDACYGFDHYILQTNEVNLNSQLGMKFKREMLVALATNDFYDGQPEKQGKILKRYEKYMLPLEEAEWIGLPAGEAVTKAREIHAEENPTIPLKEYFIDELSEKFKETSLDDDSSESQSWINKLNIFSKSDEAKKS